MTATYIHQAQPIRIPRDTDFQRGGPAACDTGRVRVWLALLWFCGCDTVFNLELPAPPQAAPGTWALVVAGSAHSCGLRLDSSLWCWGRNEVGQLGLGVGVVEQGEPIQVGSAQWMSVSTRAATTCGIQIDGSLWCWGGNALGAVGDGTVVDRFEPTQIGTGSWRSVAVGGGHACALAPDATVWCWGDNSIGQLGTGDYVGYLIPTVVPTPMLTPLMVTAPVWTTLVAAIATPARSRAIRRPGAGATTALASSAPVRTRAARSPSRSTKMRGPCSPRAAFIPVDGSKMAG